MSSLATLVRTAGLGDSLGTLLFLVIFFIAPVIKQVLAERKKQAEAEASRRGRGRRQASEQPGAPGLPTPPELEDEPIPPFPWELQELDEDVPPVPVPVPVPPPLSEPLSRPLSTSLSGNLVHRDLELTPLTGGGFQADPHGTLRGMSRGAAASRSGSRAPRGERPLSGRRGWRAAIVTAELLAPPIALRGPGSGAGMGPGPPLGFG